MRKKILGIGAIAMIAFANLYLVSSDETMERLILLQDIESLAEEEDDDDDKCPSLSFEGQELYSYVCTDGISFQSECVDVADLTQKKCCTPEEETFCPVGTSIDPSIDSPGNTTVMQNKCASIGHQFVLTNCRNTCRNCGIVLKTCED